MCRLAGEMKRDTAGIKIPSSSSLRSHFHITNLVYSGVSLIYIYIFFYLPPSARIVHSPTDWAAVRFFTGESCRLRVNTLQFGERNWLIHHKATSCVINKTGIGIFCSIPYRCRKRYLSGSGSRLNAIVLLFFRPQACEKSGGIIHSRKWNVITRQIWPLGWKRIWSLMHFLQYPEPWLGLDLKSIKLYNSCVLL